MVLVAALLGLEVGYNMAYVTIPRNSRYTNTPQVTYKINYLNMWKWNNLPINLDDPKILLDSKYQHRPDLLSHDVYGTVDLWWIFMVANPDVIHDPVYDFKAGILIIVPSAATLSGVI